MALLLLLPLFFFVCITLLFYRSRRVPESYGSRRASCLLAAIACGLQIVIATELLSLGHALHFTGVVGWWTFSALAAGGLLIYKARQRKFPSFSRRIRTGAPEKVLLGCFLLIIATLAFIALVAAPNNWDSMTYHLTRVRHWMQHESVAHYPTHVMWHLYHSPLAGFCSMHVMILTGGDHFVNFVQKCLLMAIFVITLIYSAHLA